MLRNLLIFGSPIAYNVVTFSKDVIPALKAVSEIEASNSEEHLNQGRCPVEDLQNTHTHRNQRSKLLLVRNHGIPNDAPREQSQNYIHTSRIYYMHVSIDKDDILPNSGSHAHRIQKYYSFLPRILASTCRRRSQAATALQSASIEPIVLSHSHLSQDSQTQL